MKVTHDGQQWSNAAEDLCSVCSTALESIATWAACAWKPNIFRLAGEAVALIPFEALQAALGERKSDQAPPAWSTDTVAVAALPDGPLISEPAEPAEQSPAAPAGPENWENTRA